MEGIAVYNNNNYLQISGDNRNYSFLGKQTINFKKASGWAMKNNSMITTSFNPDELIAFNCTNNVGIGSMYLPHMVNGFKIYRFSTDIQKDTQVNFYRFGIKENSTPGKHFEVYNSLGERVFSDTDRYLKIIDNINVAVNPTYAVNLNNPSTGTIIGNTFAATKKLAVIATMPCFAINIPQYALNMGFATYTFTSSSCDCKWFWDGGMDKYSSALMQRFCNYLVVDVTGL